MDIGYITGPVIGGIIGYFTNYIAVKMLFYPRNEIRFLGHVLPFTPGAIPKGRTRLASAVGHAVSETLLTKSDIESLLLSDEVKEHATGAVMKHLTADLGSEIRLIAELSEEIEELRTEENTLIQAFGKKDAAGMKQVKAEIHAAEANMENLDKRESSLSDSIRVEREQFDTMRDQAADLDRNELTAARLDLRRDSERQAWGRISDTASDGKVSFLLFRSSIRETDRLLEEDSADDQAIKRQREKDSREEEGR